MKKKNEEVNTNEPDIKSAVHEEANDMSNNIYMTEEDYMIYKWQQEGRDNM